MLHIHKASHNYIAKMCLLLFESLTVFFEASKASLLELLSDIDVPLKKNMGNEKLFSLGWLSVEESDDLSLTDSVCSISGALLKSSSCPTFTTRTFVNQSLK